MIKNKLHHEHDKIMKKILTNKKEAVILLNDTIQPIKRLKPENIETVENTNRPCVYCSRTSK